MPRYAAAKVAPHGGKLPGSHAEIVDLAIANVLVDRLRPYQLRWIQDQSRYKIGNMARQIGKSYGCIALEAVLLALQPRLSPEHSSVIVSASDGSAAEVLKKATYWADLFNKAMIELDVGSIYSEPPSRSEINLFNGGRIFSLSSNPRTIAGYTGDVFWDEVAKTPHDALVWEAVFGIVRANKGYRLRLTSTPWGDSGTFYEFMDKKPLADGWSRHFVDIYKACREGHTDDPDDIKRMVSPALFQQDYECVFTSSESQVFRREVLDGMRDLAVPTARKWSTPDKAWTDKRDTRRAIGVDVGRTNDLFAICWVAEIKGFYRCERVYTRRNMPFAEQRRLLTAILANGRSGENYAVEADDAFRFVHQASVDNAGLGMQLAEELRDDFPGVVECVMTSSPGVKTKLIKDLLAVCEAGFVQVQDKFETLHAALGSFRRELRSGGGESYVAARTAEGHADEAIAFALAVARLRGTGGGFGLSEADMPDEPTTPGAGILSSLATVSGSGMLPSWKAPPLRAFGSPGLDAEDLRELREYEESLQRGDEDEEDI